jgi:hypothetical protein
MYDSNDQKKAQPIILPETPGVQYPSISDVTVTMLPRGLPGTGDIVVFSLWMQTNECLMISLCGSKGFEEKQWDSKKGLRSEYGKTFCCLLEMAK